jgi:hypothetical protein
MSIRALLVPFSLSLLVACDQIKDLAGGGDETTVHTNEDTDDDPPPPPPPDMDEEPEMVTETASLETSITVQKGQRSKMMGVGTDALKDMAKKRGYTGVRKVRVSDVNCTAECEAKVTGTAWRKVEKKSD